MIDINSAVEISESRQPWRQAIIVLIGLAAVIAAVTATLQVHYSKQEEARLTEADAVFRYWVMATAVAQSYQELKLEVTDRKLAEVTDAGNLFATVIPTEARSVGRSVWRAETRANERLQLLVDRIDAIPNSPELPRYMQAILKSDVEGRANVLHRSLSLRQQAKHLSASGETLSIALFLTALATALIAVAGVIAPSRATLAMLFVGCLALAGAAFVSASAVIG